MYELTCVSVSNLSDLSTLYMNPMLSRRFCESRYIRMTPIHIIYALT